METKNKNQIKKMLGKDERYNACPKCGSYPCLYVDESGEYCVGCIECEEHSISTYLLHVPENFEEDMARACWNLWATGGAYSFESLNEVPVHRGDYVVASKLDGFIEFVGCASEMFNFLSVQKALNKQAVYTIYTILNGRMVNLGLSLLVDLTIKHCKEEK